MIAEYREPKGLHKDTPAIGAFQAAGDHRDNAERGSAMLRDAILRAMGITPLPAPLPNRQPLHRAELCPTCHSPVAPPPRLIASIQRTVAAYFSIPIEAMTGSSRRVHISHARQIAMYLSTELTRHSVAEVGRRFRKDHTTVLHAIKAVRARCETDDQQAFDVALLRERLTG